MRTRFFAFVITVVCWSILPPSAHGQGAAGNLRGIYIKLKADIANTLKSDLSTIQFPDPRKTGIASLDAANAKYKAVSMQRVFPHSGSFETKHRQCGLHQWYVLGFAGNISEAILAKAYQQIEAVEYAEPTYDIVMIAQQSTSTQSFNPQQSPAKGLATNDPYVQAQWSFHNTGELRGCVEGVDIHLFEGWQTMRDASNVVVALIGYNVDVEHPDLVKNIWENQAEMNGKEGVDDDGNGYIDDYHGHHFSLFGQALPDKRMYGTAVAGVIAASNNNGEGIASVAGGTNGNGAKIMVCDVSGKSPNLAASFVYAADNGALLCQADWHYAKPGTYNKVVYEAIQYFTDHAGEDEYGNPRRGTRMRGGLIVAPAGDENNSQAYYPQSFGEVVTVAAVTAAGKKARYSNYGSAVTMAAPGGDVDNGRTGMIATTLPNNQYNYQLGTALASAHVSGTAALLLEQYGNAGYTPEMLFCRLSSTARSLSAWEPNFQRNMGTGLLDVGKALIASFPSVEGISLSGSQLKIKEGEAARLQAQVYPTAACARKVIWSSSKPNIASVSSSGLVKALAQGTTDITATTVEGSYKAVCGVEVGPPDMHPVTGIVLFPATQNIQLNEGLQLVASVQPQDAGNSSIVWSSSKPEAVSVNTTGKIIGLKCGEAATITATTSEGNFTANCVVTVGKLLKGIALSKAELMLQLNQVQQISALMLPQDACPTSIEWKSSDPSTVSVDQNGKVQGLACGSATVTAATSNGFTGNCVVSVGQVVSGISLQTKEITLSLAEQKSLTATVMPATACKKGVSWMSEPASIVSVDQQGNIKGLACGEALVTATSQEGSFTASCAVKVGMPVTGVSLSDINLALTINQEIQLSANALPKEACNKALKWTSSNPNFVVVDARGKVKGIRCGKAVVTVSTEEGNYTATCKVEVGKPVTGVSLQPTSVEMGVNERRKLNLSVMPSDACDLSVNWSSSNPAVANVGNDGLVTTIACGEAIISVSTNDGGFSARCNITVGRSMTGISLSPSSLNMTVGKTQQMQAMPLPADACGQRFSWLSTDPSVASVDNKGAVNALACGTSTIIVKSAEGGYSAQCVITVGKTTTGVSLSRSSIKMSVGQEEHLLANVLPSGACNTRVSWVSSKPSVVTVTQNGTVRGIAAGRSTITVTTAEGGFSAVCEVTIE